MAAAAERHLSRLVPFYRSAMTLQWAGITNRDLLAPERWPENIIHSDYRGDVCVCMGLSLDGY